MTLSKARKLAEEAAESSVLDADPSDTMRLLAQALAELAKSLDTRLTAMEHAISDIKSKVQQLR